MNAYENQAANMMTNLEKRLSDIREAHTNRLAEAGLSPESCTLRVTRIYRNAGRSDGMGTQVSYDNEYTVHGTIRDTKVTLQGYYSGCLPYGRHEHTCDVIWHPQAHYVDFVTVGGTTVYDKEAKEVAAKMLPLVEPYTNCLEAEARAEIRKHDKWVKEAPERERKATERKVREEQGNDARKRAAWLLSKRIGKELDVSDGALWRDTSSWGSQSYYFKHKRSADADSNLSQPEQIMEYDRELWITELMEKFDLNESDVDVVFERHSQWLGDGERIRLFGAYGGKDVRKCPFVLTGTIKGMIVSIKGYGYAGKDKDVRGCMDLQYYYCHLDEVVVGEVNVPEPERYGWQLARVIDSMTPPNTEFQKRKHQEEVARRECERKNKEEADKAARTLDDLLGM